MQEKFDGKRLLIRQDAHSIHGINRSGLIVTLPTPVMEEVEALGCPVILDGESVGECFMAFDLLDLNGTDLRGKPYYVRQRTLAELVPVSSPHFKLAETAWNTSQKTEFMNRLRSENKEGAVFKRYGAAYTPGRPASGGDALKLKFYETASFIVARINSRRSVALTLLKDQRQVPVGNVSIPANHHVPSPGAIVEVRYLYAFPDGCIYQPVYLGQRDDIPRHHCTADQLKYKAALAA